MQYLVDVLNSRLWSDPGTTAEFSRRVGVEPITPDMLRNIVAHTRSHRDSEEPLDVAPGGMGAGRPDAPQRVAAYAEAGATRRRETVVPKVGIELEEWERALMQGPSR